MQKVNLVKDRHNLLSIGEASEYLGISIDTLRRWEKKEKIKAYRSPGGHRYFKKDELDNLFGRKYEREKEVLPRTEKKTVTEEQPKLVTQATTTAKPPDIRIISEREPRVVNIPINRPISIISRKAKMQHTTTTTLPELPQVQPQTQPQKKSILDAPGLKTQPSQQTPKSKNGLGKNMIVYIIAAVIAIIIIIFTIFVIISSNREILSPIP